EAMACGTPVVATPRGAFPEIVRDGVTGFLRSDVDGLADAARRVGELDPRACRDHVRASFDDAVMTARYEAVYASIAGGRRGAPDGPRADGSAASDGEAATADGSAAPARS
ncbi:MAG TPA: glycosyltransferase, partial [Actinomycetota bacterium]